MRWALSAFGDDVKGVVLEEIEALEAEVRRAALPAISARDEALFARGVASDTMRASLRRAAIRADLPCLRARGDSRGLYGCRCLRQAGLQILQELGEVVGVFFLLREQRLHKAA